MTGTKRAAVVLLASLNGRDGWYMVKPEDVPAWVKDPDTMGRIVAGESCMKCDEGVAGSLWYRAATEEDMPGLGRILAAKAKRLRRAEKRVAVVRRVRRQREGMTVN